MTETKPKRRWFRYSLRTFLVIVTLICVWLGWEFSSARKQKHAVEAIRAIGGTALYDYEVDSDGIPLNPRPDEGWLARWIGMDYVHNVVSVSFPSVHDPGSVPREYEYDEVLPNLQHLSHVFDLTFGNGNLHDDDLRYLTPLKSLVQLRIFDNRITGAGFRHLSNLKELTWLGLFNCPIDDEGLAVIAKSPRFEWLTLDNTTITDDGVEQLTKVPSLKILNLDTSGGGNSHITDSCIESLSNIAGLNAVGLRYTLITADGIQRLSELKPSLYISCLPSQAPPHPGKNVNPK
jgi:hypothetical protein